MLLLYKSHTNLAAAVVWSIAVAVSLNSVDTGPYWRSLTTPTNVLYEPMRSVGAVVVDTELNSVDSRQVHC